MKRDRDRRAVIRYLGGKGMSVPAIAAEVKADPATVRRWLGRGNMEDLPRAGRPPTLDPKSRKSLKRQLRSKRGASQRALGRRFSVDHTTVGRAAKRWGLKFYHPRHKVVLTPPMRKARVQFAEQHKDEDWSSKFFEDEKSFEIGFHPNRKNYGIYAYCVDEVPEVPRLKHPAKLHVAAAVSERGRSSLAMFEENMTANTFKQVLQRTILPGGNKVFGAQPWTLVMDNDPKHRAGTVSAYLDSTGINYLKREDWPANSPDLNPMDNVFSMLTDAVNKNPPRTLAQLRTRLRREWVMLPQEKIANTVRSLPRRLKAVKAAKGGHTKY